MSDTIISVEHLTKVYRLNHEGARPESFRELVTSTLTAPLRRLRNLGGAATADTEEFWALKDVSFQVKRGEVVGIIGRNGAGKSTLLKVLSRIVEPTSGRAVMRGRVASLLEVGTGFHPELTGRENIYMNGAILGMKRREIAAKFDEIVAFAEVEKFLDTPVKRYSSGMYVRLAFAVAAHLDPEILIVDEVLAVGDSEFQKKCLGKMRSVATTSERTVLFVSHNMSAVRTLCTKGLLLHSGTTEHFGDVLAATDKYMAKSNSHVSSAWDEPPSDNNRRDKPLRFSSLNCELVGSQPAHVLVIVADLAGSPGAKDSFIAVDILDSIGTGIMQAIPTNKPFISGSTSTTRVEIKIKLPALVPGSYSLTFWVGPHNSITYDQVNAVLSFEVTESPEPGRSVPHTPNHGWLVPASEIRVVRP